MKIHPDKLRYVGSTTIPDHNVLKDMQRHGQHIPVYVKKIHEGYEYNEGFSRAEACRKLRIDVECLEFDEELRDFFQKAKPVPIHLAIDVEYVNPRKLRYGVDTRVDETKLEEIKESLKNEGFKFPILVTKDYIIVDGEYRAMAAVKMGLEIVPIQRIT